jgi:hypothetical protein
METLQKEPGQATAVAKAIYQKLYILQLLNVQRPDPLGAGPEAGDLMTIMQPSSL